MCLLCIASFRGPPIGGQDSDGVSNRRSVLYTLCLFEAFPSRGNEKIGGTGYCVTYDTDSQSRNVLASPLGEEGHEVAKGCTRVRMIMILDVDVTAEGGIIKFAAKPPPQPSGPKAPSNLRTFRPSGRSILRTFPHNADFISIAP